MAGNTEIQDNVDGIFNKKTDRLMTKDEFLDGTKYKMDHKSRGYALIINVKNYETQKFKNRDLIRANADVSSLQQAFQTLGYSYDDIIVHDDKGKCKKSDITDKLKSFARQDHRDIDCLFVVILAVGKPGIMLAEDDPIDLNMIVELFQSKDGKNATLADKPKVFIIQTEEPRHKDKTQKDGLMTSILKKTESHTIPIEANFFIFSSLLPEEHEGSGSLFISCLTKAINDYGQNKDFMSVCNAANYLISNSKQLKDKDDVEVGMVTSMLIKDLCFPCKDS